MIHSFLSSRPVNSYKFIPEFDDHVSNFVLSFIHYYHLQYKSFIHYSLRLFLCHEMEQIHIVSFLWGNMDQSHRAHLIGWNVCYRQKNRSGLGLNIPPNIK